MTTWFTADTHFCHANVIKYSKRPFQHVDEMNSELIKRWNNVVQPEDTIYHLGDFAFCKPGQAIALASGLNGHKHLVFGNHDKKLRNHTGFLQQWEHKGDLIDIEVEGQRIVLCHYAMLVWNKSHYGSWMLHGHSHGSLNNDHGKRVDVGMDCWNYTPVSFETLRDGVMAKRAFSPEDRHGDDD